MVKMTKTNLATLSLIAKEQNRYVDYLGSYKSDNGTISHKFAIGFRFNDSVKEKDYIFDYIMVVEEIDNELKFNGIVGTNQMISVYDINKCQIIVMMMNSRLLRY